MINKLAVDNLLELRYSLKNYIDLDLQYLN